MKTLVVGNSFEVIPIIESIVSDGDNPDVTLFLTEGLSPYERSLLPDFLASVISEGQLYKNAESSLKTLKPLLVNLESLARISVKRRRLTTQNKAQIAYDRIVLVDTGALILPDIRGCHRKGVFDCWRLSSIKALKKHLALSANVMVPVTNIQGLNTACALARLKKEVTVISSDAGLLPDIFDEETGLLLKQILEGKGIRVFAQNSLDEILGDAEVKAVRLGSGKVLACDTVIFDEARADIRMLSEPVLEDPDLMAIEACFKPAVMPLAPAHFGGGLLDGFFAGWTKMPEEGREYLKFDGPQNVYKKIYAHKDQLAGIVTFNAPEDAQRLWEIMHRQESIAGKEEGIL